MTLELHFSVAGYGGLRLPFRGITEYLRGLVSVYERPIIAGIRALIVSSTLYFRITGIATTLDVR